MGASATDTVRDVVDLAELPSGKKIQFVRSGRMSTIQFSDGGQLPKELLGGFTDVKNAQSAADSYVARVAAGAAKEAEGKERKVATRRVSK